MKNCVCQECNKIFTPSPGSFGKYCSLSCSTSHRNKLAGENAKIKYNQTPKLCSLCSTPLDFFKRKNKFCSHSCAAKISNLTPRERRGPIPKEKFLFSTINFYQCFHTGLWYSNREPDGSIRRTSPYIKTKKQNYYWQARFRFNVYHYPDEFDLSLLDEHGWYSCPGRKRKNLPKNTNGVSRDHIISVIYGFNHDIDPGIIAHPANCCLLLHKDNKKKSTRCNLSLEDLLVKINQWNKKYNSTPSGVPASNR